MGFSSGTLGGIKRKGKLDIRVDGVTIVAVALKHPMPGDSDGIRRCGHWRIRAFVETAVIGEAPLSVEVEVRRRRLQI